MKDIKVKNLKLGQIYSKNGFTVYYSAGYFILSFFGYCDKFATLKELKQEIKKQLY